MDQKHLRWGILSCARIAREKVIPAIQNSQRGTVVAIASRNTDLAHQVAKNYEIPVISPTYDELIDLSSIDAIYIPLPNHLHIEWASRAIKAGKHVLCEKPLGLSRMDIKHLVKVSGEHPEQLVAEAFMYRYHPQWIYTKELIQSGKIGELRSIHVHFSYDNRDPNNIRNRLEYGGGALMDIGCYGISVARWLYDAEPVRVCAQVERDPEFKTDISTSILLDFDQGSATITCGTQMHRSQYVILTGTEGRLALHTPFNMSPNEPTSVELQQNLGTYIQNLEPVNQFSEQSDAFAAAVFDEKPFSTPITDSLYNMGVIDACFQSGESGTWITF
ncbi:MAG: Gfo/Idh/MocA family oxidoreductase [Bacteroidetes bacterium]|nr:Gfo/Idh/MocA family oxidoreductase [Bacteroidota bacterium]MCY4204701.1 Gfo/Idh/MocA family oxidoreductase [Bacteroidota bacterium]